MIKSYQQLTGKYLKASKKRTMLTLVGIILSVALISTIGLFFKGIEKAQFDDTKAKYGSFHVIYREPDKELIAKVTNNPKVSRSGLLELVESVKVDKYLTLDKMTATDKALELLPYRVKQGDFPKTDHEIALEEWAMRKIDRNAKVGSEIIINGKSYKLSGIIENTVEGQLKNKGLAMLKNNKDSMDMKKSYLLAEVSSKTSLKKALVELKSLSKDKHKVGLNTALVQIQRGIESNTMNGLMGTLAVIISIVVISTIAVIYNSFQISVVERIKQFGLLRAVGTTPKQIRRIVLREATILGFIGVAIGLLLGIAAMYSIDFVFSLLGGDSVLPIKIDINLMVLGISAAVGIVSVYISAALPAFLAGRVSPLVAISSRNSITKEKYKRKRMNLAGKLFGFEGVMAGRNIKRNRKRYRITVFSIVISVMLFVSFKSFMDMALNFTDTPNESTNVHFSLKKRISNQADSISKTIYERVSAIDKVKTVYKVYDKINGMAVIENQARNKEAESVQGLYTATSLHGRQMTQLNSFVGAFDEKAFAASKGYVKSGSLNLDSINNENGVVLVDRTELYNKKTRKEYIGPTADLGTGDKISLKIGGAVKMVKIMAVLSGESFNFNTQGGMNLMTTTQVASKLLGGKAPRLEKLDITLKALSDENEVRDALQQIVDEDGTLDMVNYIDNNRKEKSIELMMQLLVYGFVVVVSLIGCINIINTLTNNIILRKREFASLKSIGMTQQGVRKMIVLEGLLYGVVGAIYGSIIGCVLSYVMAKYLFMVREFGWHIPWDAMGIGAVSAIAIGYLSVLAPLARIKKENLIETIREDY